MKNYRINIIDAIKSINPDAQIRLYSVEKQVATDSDVDTCTLEWLEGTTPISKADIKTKLTELKAEYDAKDYARKRDEEYPSLKEFAEAYCEKEIGGDDTKWNEYKTKYNKVRTDNPKESS